MEQLQSTYRLTQKPCLPCMVPPEKFGLHAQMHSQSPDNQSTASIFNAALRPLGVCCMLKNMQITLIIPVANTVPE